MKQNILKEIEDGKYVVRLVENVSEEEYSFVVYALNKNSGGCAFGGFHKVFSNYIFDPNPVPCRLNPTKTDEYKHALRDFNRFLMLLEIKGCSYD